MSLASSACPRNPSSSEALEALNGDCISDEDTPAKPSPPLPAPGQGVQPGGYWPGPCQAMQPPPPGIPEQDLSPETWGARGTQAHASQRPEKCHRRGQLSLQCFRARVTGQLRSLGGQLVSPAACPVAEGQKERHAPRTPGAPSPASPPH